MRDRECKEGQGQNFSKLHLNILHISLEVSPFEMKFKNMRVFFSFKKNIDLYINFIF